MLIKRRWKWVVGYEGRYEVSSNGLVRSWLRTGKKTGTPQPSKPKILKQQTDKDGYKRVTLTDSKKKEKLVQVHRIMLIAFEGDQPALVARHKDGVRDHNNIANLEWGTPKQNSADMMRHGNNKNANKTHCPAKHEYNKVNTRTDPKSGARFCRVCQRISAAAKKRQNIETPQLL